MPGHHDQPHGISRLYGLLHQPWMKSDTGWIYNLLAAALILMAGLINYDARDSQWQEWQTNKPYFFADGSPLVSTTDAGYFLSYARDYQEGKFDFDQSRSWPEHAEDPPEMDGATDIPLLSVIIRHLADTFYNGDLLMAGNAMIPFTALLTAIAIGLSFWAAGFPAEGAIAGLGTGLSYGYFLRTSIGRIDTDQLILFFISLVLGAILLACRQADRRHGIFYILLAAGLFHLFHWWYDRPLFLVLMPGIVFAAAILHRTGWKTSLILTGVFILAINPVDVVLSVYPVISDAMFRFGIFSFEKDVVDSLLNFPNLNNTITELKSFGLLPTLDFITSYYLIGIIGLFGFFLWALIYTATAIVFLPFIIIGLAGSIIGHRFSFYASPAVWFGFAWVLLSVCRLLRHKTYRNYLDNKNFQSSNSLFCLPVVGICVIAILGAASYLINHHEKYGNKIPSPIFPSDIISAFETIKKEDNGMGGILTTWWDYGYILHFKTDLPTLHDPGDKGDARTYLLGRGFIESNQNILIDTIRFIVNEGKNTLASETLTLEKLNKGLESIRHSPMPNRPIYIVVTGQMTEWLRSMATVGLHDVINDKRPSQDILNQYGYFGLNCRNVADQELNCNGKKVNLSDGTIDGKPVLARLVQTIDGIARNNRDFQRRSGHTLLVEKVGQHKSRIYLVPEYAWVSTFNQLYKLGLYNKQRLELVLDQYPTIRVYKILQ